MAMIVGVVLIRIGQSGYTSFGNFAATFHIILKKIPYYFFAFVILIHGFSFGFWILERNVEDRGGETHFNDYWKSSVFIFMMAFGIAEFDFNGAFVYDEETSFDNGNQITVMFVYILLALMVFLIVLGVLNLLLSTIIKDQKVSEREVRLYNLMFMAKYAIWVDFIQSALWFKFGYDKILKMAAIKDDEKAVYCTLNFCPQRQVTKIRNRMLRNEKKKDKANQHGKHMLPHFQWVVNKLKPQVEPQMKSIKTWVSLNKGKEKVEWEMIEALLGAGDEHKPIKRNESIDVLEDEEGLL
jgi:hypothetical protein